MIVTTDQLRNFFALFTLFIAFGSPLRIFSAPTFFPLLGQPDLRRNRLLTMPQELIEKQINSNPQKILFSRIVTYLSAF